MMSENGTARLPATDLGGPKADPPPSCSISCRSTRIVHSSRSMSPGRSAANDGSIRSKGTTYLVLHPHGLNMSGRWVGLGYDGRIMSGWASMGQTREESETTMASLINSEGVAYVND
jgi:hypothetical protein